MSYHQDSGRKKKYDQPMPTVQKGKPSIKPKGKFEEDLISKESENKE
jgi:hypothetical protein